MIQRVHLCSLLLLLTLAVVSYSDDADLVSPVPVHTYSLRDTHLALHPKYTQVISIPPHHLANCTMSLSSPKNPEMTYLWPYGLMVGPVAHPWLVIMILFQDFCKKLVPISCRKEYITKQEIPWARTLILGTNNPTYSSSKHQQE